MSAKETFSPKKPNHWRRHIAVGATAAILVAVVRLGIWGYHAAKEVINQAPTAVAEFHRQYAAGDYAAIYMASDPVLQQGLTQDEAVIRFDQVRAKLGNVVLVTLACSQIVYNTSIKAVRIEYQVTFEGAIAWETFDWRLDGPATRLMAYTVETGIENGGPPDWQVTFAPGDVHPNGTTCMTDEVHWWGMPAHPPVAAPRSAA
jgi:hypothetical protein